MNKPPFKRGANVQQPNMATTDEEKFDPIKEFADDPTAYDIHYYNNAIFALKGSKEELKYPYPISGCLNCCPVDKDLKCLSPIHIAQSYLIKDLQPILGRKTRDYFETRSDQAGVRQTEDEAEPSIRRAQERLNEEIIYRDIGTD